MRTRVSANDCFHTDSREWVAEISTLQIPCWPSAITLTDLDGPDIDCPRRDVQHSCGDLGAIIYRSADGTASVHLLND
jgi:hypothetical protein